MEASTVVKRVMDFLLLLGSPIVSMQPLLQVHGHEDGLSFHVL
jgi:hypothetical protein